jgi:tRNA/tmRNA/rRNA uracil-C5-methylase (TrmA/RlmC/RlmD family)
VRGRVRASEGPASDATDELDGADVVIVDPPRKGLDANVLAASCERPPRKLLYVACGRESFERDATALLGSGKVRLSGLTVFDLFPHTGHVEVLGVFERT